MASPILLPVSCSWSEYCAGTHYGSSALSDALAMPLRQWAAAWLGGARYSGAASPAMIAGSALDAILSSEPGKVFASDTATITAKIKADNPGKFCVTADTFAEIQAGKEIALVALHRVFGGEYQTQATYRGTIDGLDLQTRPDFVSVDGLVHLDLKYTAGKMLDQFERDFKWGNGHAKRYRIQTGLSRLSGAERVGFLLVESGTEAPRCRIAWIAENEIRRCAREAVGAADTVRDYLEATPEERRSLVVEEITICGDTAQTLDAEEWSDDA